VEFNQKNNIPCYRVCTHDNRRTFLVCLSNVEQDGNRRIREDGRPTGTRGSG